MSQSKKKICEYCKEEKEITQTCLDCGIIFCSCIKHKNAPIDIVGTELPQHCPKCGSTNVTF